MYLKSVLICIIFSAAPILANAQYNSQKCRWEKIVHKEFQLDSLSVDAGSISVQNLPDSLFSYNINTGKLELAASVEADSIYICYRTLAFRFNELRFNRSLAVYDSNAFFKDPPVNSSLLNRKEELFASPELNKTGSLSRGISFGNTQNLFVNSALNLQLEGKISEDINIRAVISDQNIPLQPEGNTQQLQEFDKVFIQLYNDHGSLTAGDVVLQNKASHFLRYYKNVQGGQLETSYKVKGGVAETAGSISVAKGKFASVAVPVMEGVSGPYRLRGPENERFIIVLANSERVFLDGKLLQRGFNYDYTIDYNLGEITFTPGNLITKYSRVRVDFEYSERNYSRTIMNGSHYQSLGKVNIYLNMYGEKDNPHQPLSFPLSNEQKLYLSEIGDNQDLAIISAYDSVAYSNNRILYKKTNYLHEEQVYEIFTYTNNPDSARFSVSFTEVGAGKGNYNQVSSNANGRIYQFVPPFNGVPQGRFEPVRNIPLPNQKQMFTAGAEYAITEKDKVFSEVALSNHDLNRYSKEGNHDNQGKAFKVGYMMENRSLSFSKGYKISSAVDYEFNDENFRPIDRYRYIEFDRDWSFDPLINQDQSQDHIFNWTTEINKDINNRIQYRLSARNRGEQVNGLQHHVNLAKKINRFQLSSQNFAMNNRKRNSSSEWYRSFTDFHYVSKFLVPGYEFRLDQNVERATESGKILNTAMNYYEHRAYLRSNDTLNTRFDLSHSYRVDNDTLQNRLIPSTRANTTNIGFTSDLNKNNNLNFIFTYRNLEHIAPADMGPTVKKDEETVMGRVDWFGNLFERHVRSEVTYAVGNGRELKREFIYLQVPTGEGTHTWRDDNGDGIQDLNEFYEAINADERNYARIFVPTDEYILAYSNNFNYRLNIDLPRAWRNLPGMKGFLSRFSNVTYWTIDKKITDPDFKNRLIPFSKGIKDENLLSVRENFRSTLFFNRANPKFGFEGGILFTENKQLLTNGFETSENSEYRLNTRYNIQKIYNINIQTLTSLRASASDFLEGRNYTIRTYKFSPELAWQPTNNFRLTGAYGYNDRQNILLSDQQEKAHFDEVTMDVRLTKASMGTFSAVVRYIKIDFEGEPNTPLGYALLDALQPGNNMTWTINLQQRITSGLQMNFNYEGRKSGDVRMIHIGRMQVSALF